MAQPAPPLNADEVVVGTPHGPGIMIAATGTTMPKDTEEAWPTGWSSLGYASEDGVTIGQSTTSEALTPWQSVAPIRNVITAREVTAQFTLWQLNARTLSLYFDTAPATPGADGSLAMDVRTDQAGRLYMFGVDSLDGDRVFRLIFLRASLSDSGDMPISRGAVVPLDCTLSALETSGVLARLLIGPSDGDDDADPAARMKPSGNGTGAPAGNGGNGGGSGRRKSPGGLDVGTAGDLGTGGKP